MVASYYKKKLQGSSNHYRRTILEKIKEKERKQTQYEMHNTPTLLVKRTDRFPYTVTCPSLLFYYRDHFVNTIINKFIDWQCSFCFKATLSVLFILSRRFLCLSSRYWFSRKVKMFVANNKYWKLHVPRIPISRRWHIWIKLS